MNIVVFTFGGSSVCYGDDPTWEYKCGSKEAYPEFQLGKSIYVDTSARGVCEHFKG